jgi:acyl carrier protein
MRPDVVQTVVAAIAKVKQISAEGITVDQTFEELAMDSLDGLNVVFELEKAFSTTIPSEEALQVRTVGDVVETLERVFAGTHAGAGVDPTGLIAQV